MKKIHLLTIFAALLAVAVGCKKPPKVTPEPGPEPGPEPVAVESVTLDQPSLDLFIGDTRTLTATVLPDDADDKTVVWSSSDKAVASVENGTVTALADGTAVITAKAGEKSATCSVTVTKKPVPVESVVLDRTSVELKIGESTTLTATVLPADADDKAVSWTSSDASVVTVADGVLTGVKAGTAVITVTASGKTATCEVKVYDPSYTGGGDSEDMDPEDWK